MTPPGDTTSGLLPTAPAVGATLHVDATVLRPLRDGTVSVYRGRTINSGATTEYDNTVTQSVSGTRLLDQASNDLGQGPATADPVVVANGRVTMNTSMPWTDGGPQNPFELVLLSSPVRLGERHVAIDKRYTDVGTDLDGDKLNDQMDVAIWTLVKSEDTIDLPQRSDVKAVRVDTEIRLRARYSSDGSTSDVVSATVSEWYAPGLGLVRRTLDLPGSIPRAQAEEVLVTMDALDTGLGYTPLQVQVGASGSPVAGQTLPEPRAAAAWDSHAVVATSIPGRRASEGLAFSQLDARGQVIKTAVFRSQDILEPGNAVVDVQLLATPDALLTVLSSSRGSRLLRLDTTGQTRLDAGSVALVSGPLEADYDRVLTTATVVGNTLWLAWIAPDGQNSQFEDLYTQFMRAFDLRGVPLGPVLRVATSTNPLGWRARRLDAAPEAGVLSFAEVEASSDAWQLAQARPTDQTLAPLVSLRPLPGTNGVCGTAGPYSGRMQVQALGSTSLLLCQTSFNHLGLADLGSQLTVPRDGSGRLSASSLLGADWTARGALVDLGASAQTLALGAEQSGRLFSWDTQDSRFYRLAELPLVAGQTDAAHVRTLARWSSLGAGPAYLMPMGNRVLVINRQTDGTLSTHIAWR
ncbi:hypothetical protein KAK07_08910 [Ideonella sp. 4Y16]|uniref:Uncharacterized protein n=1 Tax=Ideonella alba TaxID=2824118 RepID=A0A941BIG3_9BURK|nr:hypothetical protein [Ideonella alba]MBQ0932688.1 hypothetical protein [Ideonella alba]MBQ0943454.1 hypothetical protein [Ideonella alba]